MSVTGQKHAKLETKRHRKDCQVEMVKIDFFFLRFAGIHLKIPALFARISQIVQLATDTRSSES